MYKALKRIADIIISGIGLLVLAVPMAVIALAIYYEEPGPVIFKQERIGLHKEHFYIYKFRSMKTSAQPDIPTHLFKNPEKYVLKFGSFIRKTSLDELPQLLNILKGEMSVIGPRPALWNQFDLIEERDKYGANDVKPGLTGWAQVNGRDELDIDIKAKLDGEYTEKLNRSFKDGLYMDCLCFFKSIPAVIKRDGYVDGAHGAAFGNKQEKDDSNE